MQKKIVIRVCGDLRAHFNEEPERAFAPLKDEIVNTVNQDLGDSDDTPEFALEAAA